MNSKFSFLIFLDLNIYLSILSCRTVFEHLIKRFYPISFVLVSPLSIYLSIYLSWCAFLCQQMHTANSFSSSKQPLPRKIEYSHYEMKCVELSFIKWSNLSRKSFPSYTLGLKIYFHPVMGFDINKKTHQK